MIFNSIDFVLFFIIVFIVYYAIPNKYRWILLLISSCIFYMAWRAEFIFLIAFSSFCNYYISILIGKSDKNSRRKHLLLLSFIINIGLLFIFKYLMFVNHTFMSLYAYWGLDYPITDFSIILPMGISFYTFQAMGYTIDVYRGLPYERNYFKLALYIMFFPQLVAGPIERTDRLLPQFFTQKKFSSINVLIGARFMITGFFKKIVIADRVAILVNTVYKFPSDYDAWAHIIATILFAFQIYCDFSGYSDIALGAAKMLDIDLMKNFERPYFSRNTQEFWRRWHISLSSWFKDYLYIPLGGSHVTRIRYYINVMITFVISGLWHGANWTFVIWGFLHGIYQIVGHAKSTFKIKIPVVDRLITFFLVCFAWIFFRANTLADAMHIISGLFHIQLPNAEYAYRLINSMGLQISEIFAVIMAILALLFMEAFGSKKWPVIVDFIWHVGLTVSIFALGVFAGGGEFIYFQF